MSSARAPSRHSQPDGASESNIELVRSLIERGFNRGDLRVVDELVDPQFVEHQPLAPGVPPTAEATRSTIRFLRDGFPDIHLTIEEIDAVEDRVWLRIRAEGTHQGMFMGHAPTHRRFSIDVFDLVRIADGRIVEHWGVPDHLALMEQLDLLPAE